MNRIRARSNPAVPPVPESSLHLRFRFSGFSPRLSVNPESQIRLSK